MGESYQLEGLFGLRESSLPSYELASNDGNGVVDLGNVTMMFGVEVQVFQGKSSSVYSGVLKGDCQLYTPSTIVKHTRSALYSSPSRVSLARSIRDRTLRIKLHDRAVNLHV
jgi:hypothetical protein